MSEIRAKRTYTDDNGLTHAGEKMLNGVEAKGESGSLVPAGCVSYFEGPAVGVLVRKFPPNFKIGYHPDPAHQHQLVYHLEGIAAGDCMDGSSFRLAPGDFASVEDDHGTGHTAYDAGGAGFTQLFVSVPAG